MIVEKMIVKNHTKKPGTGDMIVEKDDFINFLPINPERVI